MSNENKGSEKKKRAIKLSKETLDELRVVRTGIRTGTSETYYCTGGYYITSTCY
jgi:hypothetical protein